jgi:polar amino acid transport system substrate-binding protein
VTSDQEEDREVQRFTSRATMLVVIFLVGLLGPAVAKADKLQDILERGVVRIIVFGDVPPFGSQNAARELEGFDIDLSNMVAESLGVTLEMVQATAANRIPYLLTDRADINIAAMSVTAERARQVMYSAPYADTSLAVFGATSTEVGSAADIGEFRPVSPRAPPRIWC